MGDYFSADIIQYDSRPTTRLSAETGCHSTLRRASGLMTGRKCARWRRRRGVSGGRQRGTAIRAGNLIDVHIHPIASESAAIRDTVSAAQDNIDNKTFSKPWQYDGVGRIRATPGLFASISQKYNLSFGAAVIGTDGSIEFATGGKSQLRL